MLRFESGFSSWDFRTIKPTDLLFRLIEYGGKGAWSGESI